MERERKKKRSYLDTTRGHLQLSSQRLPERGIRLRLALERLLEDLELGARRALPMLDLGRVVRVEGAEVDCRGVHARREGDVGAVERVGCCWTCVGVGVALDACIEGVCVDGASVGGVVRAA